MRARLLRKPHGGGLELRVELLHLGQPRQVELGALLLEGAQQHGLLLVTRRSRRSQLLLQRRRRRARGAELGRARTRTVAQRRQLCLPQPLVLVPLGQLRHGQLQAELLGQLADPLPHLIGTRARHRTAHAQLGRHHAHRALELAEPLRELGYRRCVALPQLLHLCPMCRLLERRLLGRQLLELSTLLLKGAQQRGLLVVARRRRRSQLLLEFRRRRLRRTELSGHRRLRSLASMRLCLLEVRLRLAAPPRLLGCARLGLDARLLERGTARLHLCHGGCVTLRHRLVLRVAPMRGCRRLLQLQPLIEHRLLEHGTLVRKLALNLRLRRFPRSSCRRSSSQLLLELRRLCACPRKLGAARLLLGVRRHRSSSQLPLRARLASLDELGRRLLETLLGLVPPRRLLGRVRLRRRARLLERSAAPLHLIS